LRISEVLINLDKLGVHVTSPAAGRIKLLSVSPEIPAAAIELAKDHKSELIKMLDRSAKLPACSACGAPMLAIPTFDGFENIECVPCDRWTGCRPVSAIAATYQAQPEANR
jgi:hypothetical protein